MDPSSPVDAAPRRPASSGPEETDEQPYDGYDGRYSGSGHRSSSAATTVLVRPTRTSAIPAAPTRRRHGAAADAVADAAEASSRSALLSGSRRVGIGILVGAFLMFTVAALDSLLGTKVPVLGSFASSGVPGISDQPPLPPPPDAPGTCLSWTRPDATDTAAVGCDQPHLFEQAGRVVLADQPVFPPEPAWQKLVSERCTPLVGKYLQGKFDPQGKFRVGALKPSQERWAKGDKGMRCGLQVASRSGAMFPFKGKVAAQDQSAIQPVGTCLAIDGRTVGDPTDCAGPHAVETVGVVDLSSESPDDWPAVDDQDKFLQPACTKAANDFAGNDKLISDKGLTVYWGNLAEESWKAGSRKVNCNIGTLLPDSSGFASITGSVKGNLVVAGQPAAPAPSAPGVPAAPGSTVPAPADGDSPVEQPDPGQPAAPVVPPPSNPLDVPPGLPGLQGDN